MRDAKTAEKSEFFGLPLDVRQRNTLCTDIRNALAEPSDHTPSTCFRQHSLNAIKLPCALRDGALFGALARADCLSADGMGIVLVARLMGIRVPERVTGIDLMTDLLRYFAQDRVRIFLLGAGQEVLDLLNVDLPARFPGLIIAGTHHGYEMDDRKLVNCIVQSRADALFVALPSPRKEMFVDRFAARTGCRFAMGVGGAFDVLAGEVKRAPVIWQRAGIEFLWRMICQPRYMIPRYAHGLTAFARIVVPTIAKARFRRVRSILEKLAVVGVLMLIIFAALEGRAQIITSDKFELTNQKAAISWLETNIAGVKDPDDLNQMIDQLVAGVLSEASSGPPPGIDWQMTKTNLEALLDLFDVVLARTGTSRFLLETVLGGVVLGLTGMHPSPEHFGSLVAGSVPGLAEWMFGAASPRPAGVSGPQMSVKRTAQGDTADFVKPAIPPETELATRYSLLFVGGHRNQASVSLWGAEDYEELEGILALEDASPR